MESADNLSIIIILITLLGVFGLLIYIIYYTLNLKINRALYLFLGHKKVRYLDVFPKKLTKSQTSILIKYFPYFNKLPPLSKEIFKSRVAKFIKIKKFNGRNQLKVSEEMKVMVAASAVQLTFGLKDYKLRKFKEIIIYPEAFYSKTNNTYHLGEVNPKGVIVFSWDDFVKGYAIEKDNINLGLHEFSHALFINYYRGKKIDYHFDNLYAQWKNQSSKSLIKLRKEGSDYIRSYGQTNLMEFFSVTIECFFETPKQLNDYHPEVYSSLKKLLAQDPLLLER